MNDETLILYPSGRIDSSNAAAFEAEIHNALQSHPGCSLVLDCDRLDYIASAGLRVLLTALRRLNHPPMLRNVSAEVYEILDVTGFTSMLKVERKLRSVDIAGCKIIGRGGVSTVYRIDPDTIVKVYEIPDALEIIRNEQERAKQALLKGIPTAISYDAVRVGDRYGSVFEMVNAKTFADLLREEPDRIDELVRRHVEIIRQLHSVEAEPGELPDCRDIYLKYLEEIGNLLPPDLRKRLESGFQAMPPDLHLIHGDIHMKNVMLSRDEPLLIDMDTLSTGNPVFDFADLFIAYKAFNKDDPENSLRILGIPKSLCDALWEKTMACALKPPDGESLRSMLNRVQLVGYVRHLYLVGVMNLGGEELRETRIRHAIAHMKELASATDRFDI